MKICNICNQEKFVEDFPDDKTSLSGKRLTCSECCRVKAKEWYSQNKERALETNRKNHLFRTYGLTLEQYEVLAEKQKHCCAICKRHQDSLKSRLAVDHNHKTGEVRGLLCTNCNHRLVGRHTDGSLLRQMADYVEQGAGWFVPTKKPKKRKK